jgi:hypothetical protein
MGAVSKSGGWQVRPLGLRSLQYSHPYAFFLIWSGNFPYMKIQIEFFPHLPVVDFVILWTTARCMLVNYERTFKTDYYKQLIECTYTAEDILAESAPK